jgi:hypothetical protein
MTSIEWTKITPQMKVVDIGTHWEAAGKLITWGSRDAKDAQFWLKARARVDKLHIQRNVITSNPASMKEAKRDAVIRCKGCIHKNSKTSGCVHKQKDTRRIGTFCSYKQTKRS